MKTLEHINDLLEGKIQSIFVIKKYEDTYIMAVIPEQLGKSQAIGFVSLQYSKEIHRSELSDDTHAQAIQSLTKAFKNGDKVINFSTEKEFQEWRNDDTEIDKLLRKRYWVYWANDHIPAVLVNDVTLTNEDNKYKLEFEANRELASYELESLLIYIAKEKIIK